MGDDVKHSLDMFTRRLLDALEDDDARERRDGARALGATEWFEVLPALRSRLGREKDREAQREISLAIDRIERANPGRKDLPRTASAPPLSTATMPRAANAPGPEIRTLPRTIDG